VRWLALSGRGRVGELGEHNQTFRRRSDEVHGIAGDERQPGFGRSIQHRKVGGLNDAFSRHHVMIVLAIAFHEDIVARLQLRNVAEESIAVSSEHGVTRVSGESGVSQVGGTEGEGFVARTLHDHSIKIDLGNGKPGEPAAQVRRGRVESRILSLKFVHQLALLLIHPKISAAHIQRQESAQADQQHGKVLPDAALRSPSRFSETAPLLRDLVDQSRPRKGEIS